MDTTLKNAYTEVNQIIELLGEEYKSKIPKKVLNIFKENQDINYKTNISKNKPIDEMKISRTTLIIISILNLKYWEVEDNKKKELRSIYDENEVKFQNKISLYRQKDWLQREKNEMIQVENKEEKGLIEEKDISLIKKIIKFFKNMIYFNRKRENK